MDQMVLGFELFVCQTVEMVPDTLKLDCLFAGLLLDLGADVLTDQPLRDIVQGESRSRSTALAANC